MGRRVWRYSSAKQRQVDFYHVTERLSSLSVLVVSVFLPSLVRTWTGPKRPKRQSRTTYPPNAPPSRPCGLTLAPNASAWGFLVANSHPRSKCERGGVLLVASTSPQTPKCRPKWQPGPHALIPGLLVSFQPNFRASHCSLCSPPPLFPNVRNPSFSRRRPLFSPQTRPPSLAPSASALPRSKREMEG
jgi:hypothetical protein